MYSSKPKPPSASGDVARVVPVGDVDVLVGEQRAHGAAQQRGEVARERRDQEHLRQRRATAGVLRPPSFAKCSSVPKGVTSVASS